MELNEVERERVRKLATLRAAGIDPYPPRTEFAAERRMAADAAQAALAHAQTPEAPPTTAAIMGRIVGKRVMGKAAFVHVEDGSGRIQLFARVGEDSLTKDSFDILKDLDLGDFVEARGELMLTKTGEPSLKINDWRLLSKAISQLPFAKEEKQPDGSVVRYSAMSDPETRYRQRYADLAVNPEVREIFRTRARIIKAMREFLDHGYTHVEQSLVFCDSAKEAAKDAHAIVVLTEWDEFRHYDYAALFKDMEKPAFLFDGRNRLLLQQRALSKITFPGVWTNTCCSHQLHGQTPEEFDSPSDVAAGRAPGSAAAAVRKLEHELGIRVGTIPPSAFRFVTRLHYCAPDASSPGAWGEHEVDYVLLARAPAGGLGLAPNAEEVADTRWVDEAELKAMMAPSSGLAWSPWFRIIAERWLPAWWRDLDEVLEKGAHVDAATVHRVM